MNLINNDFMELEMPETQTPPQGALAKHLSFGTVLVFIVTTLFLIGVAYAEFATKQYVDDKIQNVEKKQEDNMREIRTLLYDMKGDLGKVMQHMEEDRKGKK